MKVHAVVPISKASVAVRSVSCHCPSCKDIATTICDGWETHIIHASEVEDNTESTHEEERETEPDQQEESIVPQIGGYVAAVYDEQWYIGVVTETDESEAHIKFMSRAGKVEGSFKWPTPPDEIWLQFNDIITEIPPPVPSGKSRRVYRMVDETVIPAIEERFQRRKQ